MLLTSVSLEVFFGQSVSEATEYVTNRGFHPGSKIYLS
jgi:hypothetical protein